jgi:flagellar hook-associated protein 3 FlgL
MNTSISTLSYYQDAIASNQQLSTQLANLQTEASTGQQYPQVSDNPTASLAILANSDQEQIIGAHLSDIQSATANLNASVSALQSADTIFSQAQSLASEAGNSTNNNESLTAMGQQVNAMISSLLSLANTQSGDTYVFGGAGQTQQPFTVTSQDSQGNPETVSYQGAANGSSTVVGTNQQVEMNYPGTQVFGGPGSSAVNAFQTLINLRNTLLNAGSQTQGALSQALTGSATALQNVQTQVQNVIGQQSASLQSMSTLQTQLQSLQTSDQENAANLGNADITNVVVQLQQYEQQLQLSFEAFSQISSTSLLSFLH